ncbi:hypothetical protein [Bacillus sp. KH172YL63]|uniref:hypothetical protein n=1 Tax=Bacillus sp. KH172YL63 TaxID=2709784 RepID=UPI0013E50BFB|nr:hypothetical protein [Bacillus sp. KH172YL63]BCB03926.1 hypothetical protein KH172YL63_20590 [Bacillus sp. KH172YL63]
MNLLTTAAVTEKELIEAALLDIGMKADSKWVMLGEGAWHAAYLIKEEGLVLRIPKKMAYDQEVHFNGEELTGEYKATQAFYEHGNRAKLGICPTHFAFSVNEELTYTVETYLGESRNIGAQSRTEAEKYGRELGAFFLALESLPSPFNGIGHLKIGEDGKLEGQLDMPLKECIIEETKEYDEELHELISSSFEFDKERVLELGTHLISQRSVNGEKIVLTNQDTSPENIIFSGEAKMIDPFPILYTGTSLAANHVFNYQTFFHSASHTERYGKANYHRCIPQLHAHAKGFSDAYTDGSDEKAENLHVEVFLKLSTMAYTHLELAKESSMTREQAIRFGTPEEVKDRLKFYLKLLESYPAWKRKAR